MTPQDIIRAVEALDKNLKQQEAEITRLRTALNFKDIMVEELKSTIRQLEAKLAEKK